MPFNIIQGHRFWYGTNGKPTSCNFLLMNKSNLHTILHHFRDIVDYWSNFRPIQEGCWSPSGWIHKFEIAKFGLEKLEHPSNVWFRYLELLTRDSRVCRADRHCDSKCRALLRCARCIVVCRALLFCVKR